jgi:hypothetical protein
MEENIQKMLEKYLDETQLAAYAEYRNAFMKFIREKTDRNRDSYKDAKQKFHKTTGGKELCQIVPFSAWGKERKHAE